MIRKFLDFLADEEGQTTMEYILLFILAAMLIIRIMPGLSQKLEELVNKVFIKITGEVDQL